MYNEQIEKLIELALADGELTEKEKQILFKKAEAAGIDLDEFEMVLEAKLKSITKPKSTKEEIQKCPSCGEVVSGLSKVCPACGFVFAKQNNTELDKGIHSLEDTLVELKSFPKVNFYNIIKPIILIYFTMGIYVLYKKLYKKEHIFSSNNNDFEQTIAKADKQIRIIKNSYGENSQVKKLLSEIDIEKNTIISEHKKSKLIAIGITIGIFLILVLMIALEPKSNRQQIEELISSGQIDKAKLEVDKLKNDYEKENFQEEILEFEIDKLLVEQQYDSALQKASVINSEYKRNNTIEKIITKQVDKLISQKDFKTAKEKTTLIESEFKRNELIKKIDNAKKITK